MSQNHPSNSLLSSGLPFEFIVSKQLSDLKLSPAGQYTYDKEFDGDFKEFSIDNIATLVDKDDSRTFELNIECKYNHDSVWVFFRDLNQMVMKPTVLAGIIPADVHKYEIMAKYKDLPGLKKLPLLDYATFGTLTNSKSEQYVITKAAKQLQWAFSDRFLKHLSLRDEIPVEYQMDAGFDNFFVPIILTNCPTVVIRNTVSLNDIKTKPISDITDPIDYIALYMEPDLNTRSSALKQYRRIIKPKVLKRLAQQFAMSESDLEQRIVKTLIYHPSTIWVANHEKLDTLLSFLKTQAKYWI